MGLDMYAYSISAKDAGNQQVDLDFTGEDKYEIFYWRKHHDLHGWMHQLYIRKGGKSETFNCNTVRLTEDDLLDLERDLRNYNLPETTGFFFGNYPPDEESLKNDLEFIRLARDEIADGRVVIYDSWW